MLGPIGTRTLTTGNGSTRRWRTHGSGSCERLRRLHWPVRGPAPKAEMSEDMREFNERREAERENESPAPQTALSRRLCFTAVERMRNHEGAVKQEGRLNRRGCRF